MQSDPELTDEIRRFEEQYAENPDSLVFARLADLHRKAGRTERALEILDEGLERHPDYLSAHIVRARCLRALDRRRASEEVFGHVLELDGENLVALRSLAEMAWERGDGETARKRLRELLELDPSNEEARDLLEEIREGPEEGPGEGEPSRAEGAGAADGEAFAWEVDGVGAEEDVGGEDDPFAVGGEAGATADDDAFGAADDPFARAADARGDPDAGTEPADTARPDASAAGEEEPADREQPDGEDLIIEPTSRRETADDRERSDDREPVPGEEPAGPAQDAAEGEGSGRWWDFLGSGGEDETSEAMPEAGGDAVAPEPEARTGSPEPEATTGTPEPEATTGTPEPDEATPERAPDDGPGSPAVGPASEAEELRAQIEELRMQAEQESDLSDAEEDLATETLANLYEAQGFYREAVQMYEELAEQRPDDQDLRRRLERARNALEATEEASREATVSAAEELRSVLRGDASPEGRGTAGP
jgi:tetratricopeptide (TPR) repeat protein